MRLFLLLCLLLLQGPALAWNTLENWADVVLLQTRARHPLPIITAFEPRLKLEEAYSIQRLVVRELAARAPLVGFRSDLTSPLSRARLRGDQPITSAVLKDQWLNSGTWVTRPAHSKLRLAPALAFTLRQAITAPVPQVAALVDKVKEVRPVVVLVDYNFDESPPPQVQDLVAANGASAKLVVGAPLAATDQASVDAIFVEMRREDEVIERGKATNVMGGQYEALRWQVNELLARGWELKADYLLVTGPLSEPVPADVGNWVADYWDHAKIDFSVEYGKPR